jgi:DNA-binding transcriptional ArsR family regulator
MNLGDALQDIDKVIQEYAPEVKEVWIERKDTSEDQGIRTGRLHENHILGIIVKHHLETVPEITTTDIEEEYEISFKKIARSTVSTYLNQLEKENVLYKKRDGRNVQYLFQIPPASNMQPFWFVRNFCLLPSYFSRAALLAQLYLHPPKEHDKYEAERKFLIGLSILTVLKNRTEKCYLCQFGLKQFYQSTTEQFESFIKERIDVLPEELRNFILFELGELPCFGGIVISPLKTEELYQKILDFVERYHSDIEFQMSVSKHRQNVHLKRMEDSQSTNNSMQKR